MSKLVSLKLNAFCSRFIFVFYVLVVLLVPRATSLCTDGSCTSSDAAVLSKCVHQTLKQQEFPQHGMHLVCIVPDPNDESQAIVSVIKNGHENERILKISNVYDSALADLFQKIYESVGPTQHNREVNLWAAFTMDGESKINSVYDAMETTSFIIFTNGQWLWPGVSIGFTRNTTQGYTLKTLSLRPLVLEVDDFLTEDECDWIRMTAEPSMIASGTAKMDHDVDKEDTEWRTSTQTFLASDGYPNVLAIDKRVGVLTRTLTQQQEHVQVLRYLKGQKYDQHHDYFNPIFYKKDPGTLRLIQNGEKNRLATVLWYLTTVQDGGHTIFPLTNNRRMLANHDFTDCSSPDALLVSPVKGRVVIFYSLFADGGLDENSLHGACPVKGEGEVKWAANKWIWSRRFDT